MISLKSLGWNSFFEQQLDPRTDDDLKPARVVEEQRDRFHVVDETGDRAATLAGRLRHTAQTHGVDLPCVGDWVMTRAGSGDSDPGPAVIHRVLSRRTRFSRQDPGRRVGEQVIAANVDTVFLVQSLNRDLNLRRLERYLALLWESGAQPVVVLSKADLHPSSSGMREAVERAAPGVPVHVASAMTADGLEELRPYLLEGATVALVGSSGVGKSTIVNRLAGEELMRVRTIREADDRGRHTTTSRHLVLLPSGGMLLDTPGMRTVLMWEGAEGLSQTFEDVETLASTCRFGDCTHRSEPGCAVRAALESGTLDPSRLQSYDKLQREIRHQAMKTNQRLRQEEERRWKRIHKEQRSRPDKRRI